MDANKRFYLISLMDYLKNNGHRIAAHSFSKSKTPLAMRSDIAPLVPLVTDEESLDILTLDSESTITFLTVSMHEELVAHYAGDDTFTNALLKLKEASMSNVRFIFASDGILMGEFLKSASKKSREYLSEITGISIEDLNSIIHKIDFLETKFKDPTAPHKINDPKLYLRKVISSVRRMSKTLEESAEKCDVCGGEGLEGSFDISYWDKSQTFDYFICKECGVQKEPEDNSMNIMNFVAGLN